MKVYIARHGLTDWNIARKAQGRSDIPLNETGKKQARELRDKIKDIIMGYTDDTDWRSIEYGNAEVGEYEL